MEKDGNSEKKRKREKKLLYTQMNVYEAPAMRTGVRLGALKPYLTLSYQSDRLRLMNTTSENVVLA